MNLPELDISRLLDKVLIGPTLYPEQVRDAYVYELEQLGVHDAGSRVLIADIPLRQWG
jgi:hypothetical protein